MEAFGRLLQRLALRTGGGFLGPLWRLAYQLVIWAVSGWLALGCRGCRIYLKGGFGFGEPVYGVSDIDMIVVTDRHTQIDRRWRRLIRHLPMVEELFQLWTYEWRDLIRVEDRDSYLTFGLRAQPPGDSAFFAGRKGWDLMGLLDRPGLYGPRRDWRRLGSRKRPPEPVSEPAARGLFAWLELRYLWGYAFVLSTDRTEPSAAYTCQKLVTDSAATWLWLRFDEHVFARPDALARAMRHMPEEEQSLRDALRLGRELSRSPAPPLEQVLPFLARTSAKVAGSLASSAARAGATEVQLDWGGPDELLLSAEVDERATALGLAGGSSALLPLADWRARTVPGLLDVGFAVLDGHVEDAARLATLALASAEDFLPALRTNGLLVLPTTEIWHRGRQRRIECSVSDPVSTALAEGRSTASFPDLPGFSARDSAMRAVAEHRAWLALDVAARAAELPAWMTAPYHPELVELCGLLSAARAALFADSLGRGAPRLALSAAAIVRGMDDYGAAARAAAEGAYEALAASRPQRRPPDEAATTALRAAVGALPPYAAGTSGFGVG